MCNDKLELGVPFFFFFFFINKNSSLLRRYIKNYKSVQFQVAPRAQASKHDLVNFQSHWGLLRMPFVICLKNIRFKSRTSMADDKKKLFLPAFHWKLNVLGEKILGRYVSHASRFDESSNKRKQDAALGPGLKRGHGMPKYDCFRLLQKCMDGCNTISMPYCIFYISIILESWGEWLLVGLKK